MSTRFSFRYHPGTFGGYPQRFAPGTFDGSIGKTIDVNLPNGTKVPGKLLKAEVVEGGEAVLMTVEIDNDIPEIKGTGSGFSFALPPAS